MKSIYDYINSSFTINKNLIRHKQIKYIKKLSSQETKSISKNDNINWLNSSIKTILSQKISTKNSSPHSDYNKKIINEIYKEKKK